MLVKNQCIRIVGNEMSSKKIIFISPKSHPYNTFHQGSTNLILMVFDKDTLKHLKIQFIIMYEHKLQISEITNKWK